MLAEAGETENASVAYDERDTGKKGQHKINAYAISENYETVDLFISVFDFTDTVQNVAKSEIDRATTRITNFFRKAIERNLEMAESSALFEFAHTFVNFQELRENIARVNAIILTNGENKGDFSSSDSTGGYRIFYKVIDINYLYKISE
jgi:hypothetical protein